MKGRKFNLFGSTYLLKIVEVIPQSDADKQNCIWHLGVSDCCKGTITIAMKQWDGTPVTDEIQKLSLYHELTHAIIHCGQFFSLESENLAEWIARCLYKTLPQLIAALEGSKKELTFDLFGGLKWKLKLVDEVRTDGKYWLGISDYENHVIAVSTKCEFQNKALPKEEIAISIFHELMHCFLDTGQYKDISHNEAFVEFMARGIVQLIKQKVI